MYFVLRTINIKPTVIALSVLFFVFQFSFYYYSTTIEIMIVSNLSYGIKVRRIQNNNKISISERHNILCKCNKISNNLDIDVGREMECVTMKALVNYYNSFSSLVSISYIIKSRSPSLHITHNWKYKRSSWHIPLVHYRCNKTAPLRVR